MKTQLMDSSLGRQFGGSYHSSGRPSEAWISVEEAGAGGEEHWAILM